MASALIGKEVPPELPGAAQPFVQALDRGDRRLLSTLLFTLEYAAPLLSGRIGRFSSLALPERIRILQRWALSRLAPRRQAVASLKAFAMLAHYGEPNAGSELGYDGPWLDRVPVAVLPAPNILAAEAPHIGNASRLPAGVTLGRTLHSDLHLRVQACVIGTGAGGAAALARLAELGVDVVAVELGGHPTAADFNQRERDMLALLYQESGLRATANKAIAILQGKGVGGSTLHNTGLAYEPPAGIIERWRREHGFELTDTELSTYVQNAQQALGARPIPYERINANNDALRRGAKRLGWKYRVSLHNRVECCGCGYCMLGCAYNRKNNAALTLVPRAVAAGARVLADARALRIEGAPGKRQVVCALLDAHGRVTERTVWISCDVVLLACGALDTPALLLRSGFRSRRVGRGLRLHPAAMVSGVFAEPVVAWRGLPQSVIVEEFASFISTGRGGYLFIPNAASWPGMMAAVLPGLGIEHGRRMRDYSHIASAAVLLHDETQGRVAVTRSGRPVAKYWPEAADLHELRAGVRELARLYLVAGAQRVYLPYADAPAVTNEAELEQTLSHVRISPHRISLGSVHPQGSCPLGNDPSRSATDLRGALWGERDVFICDASLFPTSVGVPPQVTTMALGVVVAEHAAHTVGHKR